LHVFPAEHSKYFSSPNAWNMACLSHPLLFAHRNNMWKNIQITTLLVTQLSTAFCPHPFNTSTYYLQNMVFHLLKVKCQGSSCKTTNYIFQNHKHTTCVCVNSVVLQAQTCMLSSDT
jgi:hypothetical protein